jgi:hypothetical protein
MRDAPVDRLPDMRTTLELPEDIFLAARETARMSRSTIGTVIGDWARRGRAAGQGVAPVEAGDTSHVNSLGFHVLPRRGAIVTNEIVNRIRDEEGI